MFFLSAYIQEKWDQVHIANSTLIPLNDLQSHLGVLPRDSDIVVVCLSGPRSKEGMTTLQQAGFSCASCMTGRLTSWKAAGYPLEGSSPEPMWDEGDRVMALIQAHLARRLAMEPYDSYKLLYQGVSGPERIIASPEAFTDYLLFRKWDNFRRLVFSLGNCTLVALAASLYCTNQRMPAGCDVILQHRCDACQNESLGSE